MMEPRTRSSVGRRQTLTSRPQSTRLSRPGQRIAPPELKVKNILVPTDFSDYASSALGNALTLAKLFDARITLLYVVEPSVFTDIQGSTIATTKRETLRLAKEKLDQLKEKQGDEAKYIIDTKVVSGKPFDQITSLARGLRQDLVVIATHGRTGLKHVLLGSTAEKVVRHATCPVLVVRGLKI
jgi:universal stress protein A